MAEPERRDPEFPDRRQAARTGGRRASDPPSEWISVPAYAAKYGADASTVHKWLKADVLIHYRVGTLIRVRDLPPNVHLERKRAETLKHDLPSA